MKKPVFTAAFSLFLSATAILSAAPDDASAARLLDEAARLAGQGDWQGAAEKSAQAAAERDLPPETAARALNASMNYYALARRAQRPAEAAPAPLRFNSLFSDHAVLQRDIPIPVYGYAPPHSFVTIGFNGFWTHAMAAENGSFRAILPPQEAGGPYTLQAFSGAFSAKATDIYVGEVWVAGGQSNMEMPLAGYEIPVPEKDYEALVADVPVHMLKVTVKNLFSENDDCHAAWMTSWKGNEKTWSATASFFAYALARELKVPVGIVLCSFGGSKAQAWMSFGSLYRMDSRRDAISNFAFKQLPELLAHDNHLAYSPNYGFAAPAYAQIMRAVDANPKLDLRQPSGGREAPDYDDSAWKRVEVPGDWRQSLRNANGIAWYRKAVEIPRAWAGKALELSLGAIDKQDVTYFNGVQVGATGKGFEHEHWGTQRQYKVPADQVAAGRAVIAVRALSFANGAGLYGPATNMFLACPAAGGDPIPLAGEWAAELSLSLNARGGGRAYHFLPLLLSDNMLSAIIPYAVRGAIWYQGERNTGDKDYAQIMEALIRDWRARWNQREFAFYQVLLAGMPTGRGWPETRQRQIDAAKATGTGYASATDVGNANIHPPYKRPVGERLARCALADTYGLDIESHGPEFAKAVRDGGSIRVSFDHAAGLKARGGALGGFEVADGEGQFTNATARIDGAEVIVALPAGVKEATAVRYAWKDDPADANLYNGEDLPAIPFSVNLK